MEFEHNGKSYRFAKLSAMQQLHIARRLAPVLTGLIAAVKGGGDTGAPDVDFGAAVGPLVQAVSQMSDADTDYVVGVCMSVVRRKFDDKTWAPIWSEQNKALLFDDIDLPEMMAIVTKVIQGNLGNIFSALRAGLPQK